MKQIKVWAQLNPDMIDQSTYEYAEAGVLLAEENPTREELEKTAKETVMNDLIRWGWEEKK